MFAWSVVKLHNMNAKNVYGRRSRQRPHISELAASKPSNNRKQKMQHYHACVVLPPWPKENLSTYAKYGSLAVLGAIRPIGDMQ